MFSVCAEVLAGEKVAGEKVSDTKNAKHPKGRLGKRCQTPKMRSTRRAAPRFLVS